MALRQTLCQRVARCCAISCCIGSAIGHSGIAALYSGQLRTVDLAVPGKRVCLYKIGPERFVRADAEEEKKLLPKRPDFGRLLSHWETKVDGEWVVFETQVEIDARFAKSGTYLRLLWDTTDRVHFERFWRMWVNGKEQKPRKLKKQSNPRARRYVLITELAPGALREGPNTIRVAVRNARSVFQDRITSDARCAFQVLSLGSLGPF